jgi:uncharacterized protein YndB with AHSA1/START domain
MAQPGQNQDSEEVIITRVFDAPRERVWRAWTEPEQAMRWWGPKGFTAPAGRIDLRVGGAYLLCMRSPEGQDFWSTGTYREIVPLEKIVCTDSFADAEGNLVPASYYGMQGDFPMELRVTVTFQDRGSGTAMTLRHEGFPPGPMVDLTAAGWNESFDKLAEAVSGTLFTLPSDREVAMECFFDAPRERVFTACTERDLIPRWWGPASLATTVEEMDVRPGGSWRYIQRDDDGNEYAFHGRYVEVVVPERLAYTFEFEGLPGHGMLETATFEEHAGRTKMTVVDRFDSVEDRDGSLQSGMEEGARESQDRFAALLADLLLQQPR